MADSSVPADETVQAEAPIAPSRFGLRMFARIGIFGGLFALALGVSWQIRDNARYEDEIPEATLDPPRMPLKKTESTGGAVENLARGDQALKHHLYAQAVSHFEEALAGDATVAAIIDYRIGLCHEALGQTERALAAYRKAVSAASAPALTFVGHLAMARCLLRANQPAQARRLLYPYVFDETRQLNMPNDFAQDARCLIALSLARDTQDFAPSSPDRNSNLQKGLAEDNPVSFFAIPLDIPFYLDEVGLTPKAKSETVREKQAAHLVVQSRGENSAALILKMYEPELPASAMLEILAKNAGLRLELSEGAKKTLADRSLRLCLSNWPLLDLLEQVADSFDLACKVDGDVVQLAERGELDAKQLAQSQRALAGHVLHGAVLEDAGHPWMPAVLLELGNWEAANGRADEAVSWFQRIINEAQGSPYLAPAYYNLAALHVRKKEIARARKFYFKVVDQAAGHELALRAQIRIGLLFLEEDEGGQAIVQLKRARIMAPGSIYQPLATLALAAAYLKEFCPDQARIALAKQRALLQKVPYKATAAFLDCYAQYQLAKANKSGRREAGELLSTLWRDQDETLLGPVGHYLIAQAYRDLGFWDQAERLLRNASKNGDSPMIHGLEYLLGDTLCKQNRVEEALRVFEKLAAGSSPFRARAVFQLAQFDLQERRFEECMQKCQQLWEAHSFADSSALLKLWGTALESSGDFTKAAQCFAGKAPI